MQQISAKVGTVIYRKLCKKLKFEHINKQCIDKPESFRENEIHKILLDFEIQTNLLILPKRSALQIVYKKKCRIMEFAVPADY